MLSAIKETAMSFLTKFKSKLNPFQLAVRANPKVGKPIMTRKKWEMDLAWSWATGHIQTQRVQKVKKFKTRSETYQWLALTLKYSNTK
jgi:hypothetical protein